MQKGVRKVIENMLRKDFSMEVIAEVTGASIGEIEKLKRKNGALIYLICDATPFALKFSSGTFL